MQWRIAWRHLRGSAEGGGRGSKIILIVASFLLVVGLAFAMYAHNLGAPGLDGGAEGFSGEGLGLDSLVFGVDMELRQRWFGLVGAGTAALGGLLFLFGLFGQFFSLLSAIIIMSVLLGCMQLVVVLSLMSGMEQDLRDKILGQKAHIRVTAKDGRSFGDYRGLTQAIEELPEVSGAQPYLRGEVLAVSGRFQRSAVLLGVHTEALARVSNIASTMESGDLESLNQPGAIPAPRPRSRRRDPPWRLKHLQKKGGVHDKSKASAKKAADSAKNRIRSKAKANARADESLNGTSSGASPGLKNNKRKEKAAGEPKLPGFGQAADKSAAGAGRKKGRAKLKPDRKSDSLPEPDALNRRLRATNRGSDFAKKESAEALDTAADDDDWEDPVEELDLEPESPGEDEPPGAEPKEPPEEAKREGPEEFDAIVIGRELAKEMGGARVGSRISLITPEGRLTPVGRVPGRKEILVGGIFYTGLFQYDSSHAYGRLDVVQAFLRQGDRVSGVEIKIDQDQALESAQRSLRQLLEKRGRSDELKVETWKELNRSLFAAMLLEKIAMSIQLLCVIVVACFGILASNLMSVLEKSREIAILKAMGASDRQIFGVFVGEGLWVGVIGAAGGVLVGLVLCWVLDRYGIPFNGDMLYMDRLPVVVNGGELIAVGVAALFIVWISSLYPAYVASKVRPVEGLRNADTA